MQTAITAIEGVFNTIKLNDIVDILLVAYLIYQAIKLVRETRAVQLVKGLAALVLLYLVSNLLVLKTMSFIMKNILQIGAVALLVVFQPELRRALEQVGRSKISGLQLFGSSEEDAGSLHWKIAIDAITAASGFLSKKKIGALIVLERQTKLGEIIKTGTIIDSAPSSELLGNIFFPNSPLHDGALVIRGGRLYAAGCFLPLSDNFDISKELGTRHRAALGMSENSDAVIVIVSEETGVITVARDGKLKRGYTSEQLGKELRSIFVPDKKEDKGDRKPLFLKVKR